MVQRKKTTNHENIRERGLLRKGPLQAMNWYVQEKRLGRIKCSESFG
jgi:hypothetical protein